LLPGDSSTFAAGALVQKLNLTDGPAAQNVRTGWRRGARARLHSLPGRATHREQREWSVAMAEASPVRLSRRASFAGAAAGAALAAATFAGTSSMRAQTRNKATFVLVHPAWFGGWCWNKVTPLLRARGYDVHTPTLTGLGERAHLARPDIGLNTHIEDVANVLKYEDLSGVVLVGTSSGGMVITGVADQVPELIAHIVYLDAFVPQDGHTMLDLIPPDRRPPMEALVQNEGQGWLLPRFAPPPWEKFVPEAWRITDEADLRWVLPRLRPTPFGHFKEPVHCKNAAAEKLPRTYIRCVRWPNAVFDRHAEAARRTPGWRYRELATSHLPYVTHPREVADVLLEIVA
jgi:pimeloyl-ACP methyl ester carboxylesterase